MFDWQFFLKNVVLQCWNTEHSQGSIEKWNTPCSLTSCVIFMSKIGCWNWNCTPHKWCTCGKNVSRRFCKKLINEDTFNFGIYILSESKWYAVVKKGTILSCTMKLFTREPLHTSESIDTLIYIARTREKVSRELCCARNSWLALVIGEIIAGQPGQIWSDNVFRALFNICMRREAEKRRGEAEVAEWEIHSDPPLFSANSPKL